MLRRTSISLVIATGVAIGAGLASPASGRGAASDTCVRTAAAGGLAPLRRAVGAFERTAEASIGNLAALDAALARLEAAAETYVVRLARPVACSEGDERLREALSGWVAATVGLATCRHFVRANSTQGGLAAHGNCIGPTSRAFESAAREKARAESAVAGTRSTGVPRPAAERLGRLARAQVARAEAAVGEAALEQAIAAILLGRTRTLAAGHAQTLLRLAEVLHATDRRLEPLRQPSGALSDDSRTAWAAEAQRSLELARRMSGELSRLRAALTRRQPAQARRAAGLADYYAERLALSLGLHAPLRERIARAHAADAQATRAFAAADMARIEAALERGTAEIAGAEVTVAPRLAAALRGRAFGAYVGRTPLSVLTGSAFARAEERATAALAALRLAILAI